MTRHFPPFLLIACCLIVQLHPAAFAKESKTKEKDIAGLTYALFPDGATPSKELLVNLSQQEHWDIGAAGNLDRMPVHLRFEKVVEKHAPAGSPIHYRVFAEGAPENKVYGLATWELGQPINLSGQDVYVNAQGLVMTRRPNPEEEAVSQLAGVELNVNPRSAIGEPTRYGIYSRDHEINAFGTLVPNPAVTLDHECHLEARVGAPGAAAVLVVADGFTPKMKLMFVLESLGETVNIEVATDHNGHAEVAGFPFIQGQTQGTLKVSAQGPNCVPSVQVPWNSGKSATPAPPANPPVPITPASPAGKQP